MSVGDYVEARKAQGCTCTSWEGAMLKIPEADCPLHGFAATQNEVDSLDDMQPVPRAGKFFATRILRQEVRVGGVIVQEKDDPNTADIRTQRARVDQIGPARDGESWDFEPGYDVIVPYHAGYEFKWMSQDGITESLWIVDTNEVVAIFKPRN